MSVCQKVLTVRSQSNKECEQKDTVLIAKYFFYKNTAATLILGRGSSSGSLLDT